MRRQLLHFSEEALLRLRPLDDVLLHEARAIQRITQIARRADPRLNSRCILDQPLRRHQRQRGGNVGDRSCDLRLILVPQQHVVAAAGEDHRP
jgi:hypothetical protein